MSITESLAETRRSPTAKPRLLVFYAASVGRCRRVDGFLAQVLQRRRNHDTFRITRIDVEARPDLASRFDVSCVPALVVVEDNRIRARVDMPRGCTDVIKLLKPWLR